MPTTPARGADAVVTFRMFAAARAAAGRAEVTRPAGPISEVLAGLRAELPARFDDVLSLSSLLLDGERLDPASDRMLGSGAVIDVLPPFAGG